MPRVESLRTDELKSDEMRRADRRGNGSGMRWEEFEDVAQWDEMRWDEPNHYILSWDTYIYIHHIMIHIMIYSIPIIIYYHAQEWKLERLKICEPQSSAWPHPIGVSIFVPLYRRFMAFQFWNFRPRLARVLLVWTQHLFVNMYINIYI